MEAIWRNDQVVGYLRRADYGFSVGCSIGYGYVHSQNEQEPITTKYLTDGDYFIEAMGVKYKARIQLKPLFDPENKRVNGIYWEIYSIEYLMRFQELVNQTWGSYI